MQIDLFYHITPPRADGWNRAHGRVEPRARTGGTARAEGQNHAPGELMEMVDEEAWRKPRFITWLYEEQFSNPHLGLALVRLAWAVHDNAESLMQKSTSMPGLIP